MRGYRPFILDVCVTTRCTLRCSDCAHLMLLYESRSDWDGDDVVSALDRVLGAADCIARINIIGGESFLYGDLAQVLEYLDRHAKQFRIIKIPTNATMVPNSAVLYDALRKPYVKVCSVE